MAKVVGEDSSVPKRITCRGCGAIVEYVKNEVKEYSGQDISGGPDGRKWIVCPRCQKDITIESW